MSGFAGAPLRWKVVGLCVLLLVIWSVEVILALNAHPSAGVFVAGLAAGYVVGGTLMVVVVRRLAGGVSQVIARMDAVNEAGRMNVMRGLQALAAGDLTVELHAATAAATDFAGDELGEIARHTEIFRDMLVACYGI